MDLSAIKPRSLVEQVCDQLSEFIRTERSSGKDRLPAERRLAEQFGVGRGVVREAIKRLENQGLVNVRQGSGLHIEDKLHRPLTGSLEMLIPNEDERLRQLNEARIAMEPQAARLAARRATPELLTALRTIHAELVAAPDIQSAIETDMAFHRAVAEASGNLMFRLILDSLAEIGLASRKRTIGLTGKDTAIEHHAAILRAIELGQPNAAEQAMHFHITEAGKDIRLS